MKDTIKLSVELTVEVTQFDAALLAKGDRRRPLRLAIQNEVLKACRSGAIFHSDLRLEPVWNDGDEG